MNNFKIKQFLPIQLLFLLLTPLFARADVSILIAEPNWLFELDNPYIYSRQGKISTTERQFIEDIQQPLKRGQYDQVLAAFAKLSPDDLSPALREIKGQVLMGQQQYSLAKTEFLSVLQIMPASVLSHRNLSLIYLKQGDLAQAQKHLVKTLTLVQPDAQIYGQLGYVNLQQHDSASAIAAYENALMLEPSNEQWQQGLLYALIDSHATNRAQRLLEQMIKQNPNDAKLWLQRGQLALKRGDRLVAISSLETANLISPLTNENLSLLVKLHIQSGSAHQAVALLVEGKQALINANKSHFSSLISIMHWLSSNQRWQALTQLLSAAVAKKAEFGKSQQAQISLIQAKLAMANGDTAQSLDFYREAVAEDPANGQIVLGLANLYYQLNNHNQADLYYLRAQAMPAYKEAALLGRAQLLIDQKDYSHALDLLRQVYQQNPDRSDLIKNIRSLESLLNNRL
ncbi:tetratricopeptide repeat protein [Gayadomonas joobiniege]|uniref:tetratricopeptide repeat protein n=1 Tax=Gayadomonas joobiniege TaxID=1234606 RepID=UPI00036DBD46|nr:tetratricopeptide repeat protein [Gayadomonas joobiniege]